MRPTLSTDRGRSGSRASGALSIVLCAFLVACGEQAGTESTPSAAVAECRGTALREVRSTSHRARTPSSNHTVTMSWTPAEGVEGYSFEFSQANDTQPDAVRDLGVAERGTTSLALPDGQWYFHASTVGPSSSVAEVVHCGPYVIATNLAQGTQAAKGSDARVHLTVRVEGGSSVEFHNFNRDKYYCGDTSLSNHPVQCELDVLAGSEVSLQRTLGLKNIEEARWRLVAWGQACAATNADTEPRGGQCRLLMDGDKTVNVTFERRAMLHIKHELAGGPPLGFAWSIDPSSQKSGGNPLAFRPTQQNCQFPHQPRQFAGPAADFREADPCELYSMFDVGTDVTLQIGGGEQTLSTFLGWGGACSAASRSPTCKLTLREDSEVTSRWAVQ